MQAAAKNLTPVTLELGGKSPAIVTDRFPLKMAVDRIVAGKLLNAGQTCIAPDYCLVSENIMDAFVEQVKATVQRLYPSIAANPDYTRIINAHHYARLDGYLRDAKAKGATVIPINPAGEQLDASSRAFPPTLVINARDDMQVMQEEIFGPIMSIIPYRTIDEAIRFVNERPRPLALYYFDDKNSDIQRVLNETVSGGACVNGTIFHFAQFNMPFGGVGPSGIGGYHGYDGFVTFSKRKGIFYESKLSTLGLLRPPYGIIANTMLKVLTRL